MRLSLNFNFGPTGPLALAAVAIALSPTASAPRPETLSSRQGPDAVTEEAARVERVVSAMGTRLALRVEAADRPAALAAAERALVAIEAAEARLSTWTADSELARLNRHPAGRPFLLSPTLASELLEARRWWSATAGAFDPGVGALVRAWALRDGGRRPHAEETRAALASGGMASLELDPARAVRRHPSLLIEEGGFGKGAGLDAALDALEESGAASAVLDLGGQIALFGDGDAVRVAVADPRDRARAVLALRVERGAVATSGNGERGIVVAGERLAHLLDPRTGEPVRDFGSLTVWAPDATTADCLSTGLYVMGPDAALAWAEGHQDLEVVVVESDGRREGEPPRVRATSGLRGRLEPLSDGLLVEIAEAGPVIAARRAAVPRAMGQAP
jgi:thiamine biosynthesis lipoprotein